MRPRRLTGAVARHESEERDDRIEQPGLGRLHRGNRKLKGSGHAKDLDRTFRSAGFGQGLNRAVRKL
jgi:hypothetical protein